jgi:dihydrofolate reductase
MIKKIIAITQVTLDGVMQSPGGPEEDSSNGFTHGGWAMPFLDDVLKQVIVETIAGEFDMLLGRRTYEIFAGYWPNRGDNPIAKAFNRATKYVVTRSLDQLDWENSQRIGRDVVDEVRRLKASDGPALHIWGSSELLQTLIAAELVDEYRIWVFPLVLGEGKRLFEDGVPPRGLSLVATRSTPKGVLLNTYRPAGPVPKVCSPSSDGLRSALTPDRREACLPCRYFPAAAAPENRAAKYANVSRSSTGIWLTADGMACV